MKRSRILVILIMFLLLISGTHGYTQLNKWPKGASPEEVGKKVSNRFIQSAHGKYNTNDKAHIPYFEVCTWYGALTFAKETRNNSLFEKLEERYNKLTTQEAHLFPEPSMVYSCVSGL